MKLLSKLLVALLLGGAAPALAAETARVPESPAAPAVAKSVAPAVNGPGWVLLTPRFSTDTVLLDGRGKEAHVWPGNSLAAGGARLMPDGSLVRLARAPLPPPFNQCGVEGGRLQHVAWDGTLLWDFVDATSDHMACGDILKLPNGNILVPVLEFKSRAECEARGRDSSKITDKGMLVPGLREFAPKGKSGVVPVWKWSLWDHLYQSRDAGQPHYQPPSNRRGMVDIGLLPASKGPVWIMPMELDYHAQEDLVALVVAGLGEVWLVDHSPSAGEMGSNAGGRRGQGGRLLFQWDGSSATAEDLTQEASRIISVKWSHDGEKADLGLTLMRYRGQPFLPVVETVPLSTSSLRPEGGSIVLLQGKRQGGENVPLPSAADSLPDSGLVVYAETMRGWIHAMNGSVLPSWSYENKRGTVKLRPPSSEQKECCGNSGLPSSKITAPLQQEVAEISVAPVVRARLYSPDHLWK